MNFFIFLFKTLLKTLKMKIIYLHKNKKDYFLVMKKFIKDF